MPRGIYRHFEEAKAGDIWRARVELARGKWADVEQADYERAGYQPSFWDLPLEEDHINAVVHDPIADMEWRFMLDVEHPTFVIALVICSAVFAIVVAIFAVSAL